MSAYLTFEETVHKYHITRKELKAIIREGKERYNKKDGHYLFFEVTIPHRTINLKLKYYFDTKFNFDNDDIQEIIKLKDAILVEPKKLTEAQQ